MYHVLYCLLFSLICWRKGDLRNWRKYYPTILFFALGEMELNFIFYKYSLWQYASPNLTHTFITFLWDTTVVPSTVMLFIPYIPKSVCKKILYFLLWVAIYVFSEFAFYSIGYFKYFNGWNLAYSAVLDIFIFFFLYLHYKKPLLACAALMFIVPIFIYLTKLPLASIK
jgi:hypothetical protein